jgi:TPR repeat protein
MQKMRDVGACLTLMHTMVLLFKCMCVLGLLYSYCEGVAQDYAEALRLWQLAAAQGHPSALYNVGQCHEHGYSVAADVAEAVHWYRRAQAAGDISAAGKLHRLGFGASGCLLPQCDNAQLNTFLQQFERIACLIRVYILTDTGEWYIHNTDNRVSEGL